MRSTKLEPKLLDNTRGIVLMLAGMFLFSAVDTQAKFLTASLHPIQIVWCRQLGLLGGVLILFAMRGREVLKTDFPLLQILRGGMAALSAVLFIVGVSFVPLADAVAVSFVAPFFVTVLGAFILKEKVGIRRWSAIIIGFIGTLIILRPGIGIFQPAMLLILLAAFLFACRQVLSRILSGGDRTATTVAYTALVSVFLLSFPLPFFWQWPETHLQIGLLISLAVMAAFAELLVIKALEVAEAVVVAPVQYSLMIWGTLYGYLIFNQLPDGWTWVGALILIVTGVYTVQRDSLAARRRKSGKKIQ